MSVHKIGSYLPEVWCWCEWKKTHTPERTQAGIVAIVQIGNSEGDGAVVVPIDITEQQGVCPECGDIYRVDYQDRRRAA